MGNLSALKARNGELNIGAISLAGGNLGMNQKLLL
jgi:hypothetical protein